MQLLQVSTTTITTAAMVTTITALKDMMVYRIEVQRPRLRYFQP